MRECSGEMGSATVSVAIIGVPPMMLDVSSEDAGHYTRDPDICGQSR
jgi:hypothetical protein